MKPAVLATTGKETARRLRLLADYLEVRVPAERLCQEYYIDMRAALSGVLDPAPTCGTSACAGGWATTIPEFQRAGLMLSICGVPALRGRPDVPGRALELFFGIMPGERDDLFGPTFATPAEKATQLREVAARYAP